MLDYLIEIDWQIGSILVYFKCVKYQISKVLKFFNDHLLGKNKVRLLILSGEKKKKANTRKER